MKFIVELEDFWIEEGELTATLKAQIVNEIAGKIRKGLEESALKEIQARASEMITGQIAAELGKMITDFIENKEITIQGRYSSDKAEKISVKKYIRNLFEETVRNSSKVVDSSIEKFANRFAKDFKARYDNIFAGHIVKGLKEQGLLKADVVELLLEGTPEKKA